MRAARLPISPPDREQRRDPIPFLMPRTPVVTLVCLLSCMAVERTHSGAFGQTAPASETVATSLTLRDSSRGRDVVVRVVHPASLPADARLPIVVFSHPLGRRPADHESLLRAWAARGVVCLAPVHTDSTDFVPPAWWPRPRADDTDDRARDLDFARSAAPEIERRLPALIGKLAPARVALAAEGTGTLTALVAAGLRPDASLREPTPTDSRLRALILVNPRLPEHPTLSDRAFARLEFPTLLVAPMPGRSGATTTAPSDLSPRPGPPDPLAPFRLAPAGDKFLVTLRGTARGGAAGAAESLTATFLDAYLRDDAAARDLLLAGSAIAPFAGDATIESR